MNQTGHNIVIENDSRDVHDTVIKLPEGSTTCSMQGRHEIFVIVGSGHCRDQLGVVLRTEPPRPPH